MELRKYLNDVYYASEDENNAHKNFDKESELNTSNDPLILKLENSKAYLIEQQK